MMSNFSLAAGRSLNSHTNARIPRPNIRRWLVCYSPWLLLGLTLANGGLFSPHETTAQEITAPETNTAQQQSTVESTGNSNQETLDAVAPFETRSHSDAWLQGDWELDWSDEFDTDGKPDPKKWHFFLPELPQRNETAYLTDDHAFCKDGQLVMEAVAQDGRAEMSQMRSYDDMTSGWDSGFPSDDDFLLDPTDGPLFVEASVRFDQAAPAFRAWWAFWLLSPNVDWLKDAEGNPNLYAHYDNNAATGSEVDLFEYVPDVTRNGFNIAMYKSQAIESGIRPGDKKFTTENAKKDYGIDLEDGKYHKLGFYYSTDRYAIYVDDKLIWTFTDAEKPGWITKAAKNGILLTWEADNLSPWGQPLEKDSDGTTKTFVTEKTNARILIDYVRVHRLPLESTAGQ